MSHLAMVAYAALAVLTPASPGQPDPAGATPPETVVVLDFEVHDQGVNAGDAAEVARVAEQATRLFRERVEADDRFAVAEPRPGEAGTSSRSGSATSSCRDDGCTLEAARRAGATRVIRGRYVKVSNLIRYLAAELVDPATGRVVRSAAVELKGQRDVLLARAVSSLYDQLRRSAPRGAGADDR